MSIRIDTYTLLVDKFGEAMAYKICKELGGLNIQVPKKAHKTYRIRQIVKKAMPIIANNSSKRTVLVKRLSKCQGINEIHIYRIIREEEYGK